MRRAIARKKRFNRRAVGQLNRIFRLPNNFLEPPKEKHLNARSLCWKGHQRIVTRGTVTGYSPRSEHQYRCATVSAATFRPRGMKFDSFVQASYFETF